MRKNDKEALETLITWAKENDSIISDSVTFQWDSKSGIKATLSKLPKADSGINKLFAIPKKLFITRRLASESFQKDDTFFQQNPNAITQLYLAKLKFDHSDSINGLDLHNQDFFRSYLEILPLNLSQTYFWPIEKLNLLQGTDLLIITKSNIKDWFSEWLQLMTNLNIDVESSYLDMQNNVDDILTYINTNIDKLREGNLDWKSFLAYLWSINIFHSRAFPEIIFNENCKSLQQAFLFPVVDLLNHKSGTNVKWQYDDTKDNLVFIAQEFESLKINDEIYNNYGEKSNEELLLLYGFVEEKNPFDKARLTLKFNDQIVLEMQENGILGPNGNNVINNDTLQFILGTDDLLPNTLIKIFAYLNKLTTEDKILLRAAFEGLDEIINILQAKVEFFKTESKISGNDDINKMIKTYFATQKKIFNHSLEEAQRYQKRLLKETTTTGQSISFKTFFKNDNQFTNSLLFAFGVTKYEDLISKDCMKQVLLLWFVRIANMSSRKKKLNYEVPSFITDTIEDVAANIVIEKDDVLNFMDFYKGLFPKLSKRIPEVYDIGDWGIKKFIIADDVLDRLVWTRKINQEPILILESEYHD